MVDKAKTKKILNQFTPVRANLCSTNGVPFELPNHSRGKAPESNSGLANKKYVDDLITSSTYWTANGNDIYNSNSGKVGIGTATPAYKLDVVGTIRGSVDIIPSGHLSSAGDLGISSHYWDMVRANKVQIYNDGTNTFNVGGAGVWNVGTSRLMVSSAGNVGIGTTSPYGKLNIIPPTANPALGVSITTSDFVESNTGTAFDLGLTAITGNVLGRIQVGINGDGAVGDLTIQPNGGNVGIGTTSPSGILHVKKTGGTSSLIINSDSDQQSSIGFVDDTSTNRWVIREKANENNLKFYSYGTSSDIMTLEYSSGNVGIGTTSPNQKLDVNGHIELGDGGGAAVINYITSGYAGIQVGGNTHLAILNSNGNVGIGTTSPSQKLHVVGTTYSQGDFIIKGVSSQKFVTFADGDTTPTVAGGNNFKTANTGATTITTFDNGVEGQIIHVCINDNNTDFTNGASLILYRGTSWTASATNDVISFIHDGTTWRELNRSDNT
jgi:hypothetical protein